jgi:hypothetical protein
VVWGGVIGFAHILTKALFGGREEEERKKNLPFPSQLTGRLVQCFFAILCYLFFFPSLVALRSSFLCFFPHPLLCFFLFFFWFQKNKNNNNKTQQIFKKRGRTGNLNKG